MNNNIIGFAVYFMAENSIFSRRSNNSISVKMKQRQMPLL